MGKTGEEKHLNHEKLTFVLNFTDSESSFVLVIPPLVHECSLSFPPSLLFLFPLLLPPSSSFCLPSFFIFTLGHSQATYLNETAEFVLTTLSQH